MEKPLDPKAPASPSRRSVLIGAVAGALAPHAASATTAGSVTNAPESDTIHHRQSFHGEHQPGIVTPRPAAGLVASFDVLARDRAGLERLLRTLTERTAFLMTGGTPPVLDPKFPPADSGILGPVVTPDNLTITTSLGASLFDDRFGLQQLKPKHLVRMTAFSNDALQEELCHGDLLLQICSNTPDTNIHALRDIVKNTPDTLLLRWKQEGSVPVQSPHPGKPRESARNFLGFRDGSANPDSTNAELMNEVVWVPEARRRTGLDGGRLLSGGAHHPQFRRALGPHAFAGAGNRSSAAEGERRAVRWRDRGRCAPLRQRSPGQEPPRSTRISASPIRAIAKPANI